MKDYLPMLVEMFGCRINNYMSPKLLLYRAKMVVIPCLGFHVPSVQREYRPGDHTWRAADKVDIGKFFTSSWECFAVTTVCSMSVVGLQELCSPARSSARAHAGHGAGSGRRGLPAAGRQRQRARRVVPAQSRPQARPGTPLPHITLYKLLTAC